MSCEHVLLNCGKCTAERDELRRVVTEYLAALDANALGHSFTNWSYADRHDAYLKIVDAEKALRAAVAP